MYKEKLKLPLLAALVIIGGMYGAPAIAAETSELYYTFNSKGVLKEASSAASSRSDYWWLQSGGQLNISNDIGRTPKGSENFRLLTATAWEDSSEAISFKVTADNLKDSSSINDWNGFTLVQRYVDNSNYYYASLRMDGLVTIQKKHDGKYSTLAKKKYFSGTYSPRNNPNLIPKDTWIDARFETEEQRDGSMLLTAYVDGKKILETTDEDPMTKEGRAGIFSDYMDVSFDNFKMTPLNSDSSTGGSDTEEPVDEEAPTVTEPKDEEVEEVPSTPIETPEENGSSYGLGGTSVVQESGSMNNNSAWWVNSGAYMYISNGTGRTVMGALPSGDKWRSLYASSNPTDTDNGLHPQNIFRLVTTSKWQDLSQEAYFKINKYNESSSSNRAGHNGILFFNRYVDGNNLYYTGVRVDGSVIVKKKINGSYYTMASKKVFEGAYNRSSNPILLPLKQDIGLKSIVENNSDGSVTIKVYIDKTGSGTWTLAVETTDDGKRYGGSAHTKESYAGIRTDFMDVEFKNYELGKI